MRVEGRVTIRDRPFRPLFLAIIGAITWLVTLEHNHHPRSYRYSEDVRILRAGDGKLDFNLPESAFSICRQIGRGNVRMWPKG